MGYDKEWTNEEMTGWMDEYIFVLIIVVGSSVYFVIPFDLLLVSNCHKLIY